MQFYTIMIDYGLGPQKPMGYGADVRPEMSRREVVEEVRDILASDHRSLVFVKFTDGNYTEDQTTELCLEAGEPDAPLSPGNRIAFERDHARGHRVA